MKISGRKRHTVRRFIAVCISWVFLPCLLAVAGFLYGIVNYPGSSFFSLNHYHTRAQDTEEFVPLKNHAAVRFSFTSQMDNLGTVAVRFVLPKDEAEGDVTFRLIDPDSGDVMHTGNYEMRVLYGGSFYPLGFPTIVHSKHQKYVVMLESEYVKGGDIMLHFGDTAYQTKYHIDKIDPFRNTSAFIQYFKRKIVNLSQDAEFYSYILLYMLPTILYLIWKIMNNRYVTATLMLFIAYRIYSSVYLPLQQMGYDAELYFKLATLFFVIIKFNIGGRAYFIVALVMYLLSTLYVALQKFDIAQGYAVWTYYFISLGLCAYIWEYTGERINAAAARIFSPIKNFIKAILFL